jgi:SRSO17 transposase
MRPYALPHGWRVASSIPPFCTKPQLALEPVHAARAARIPVRTVVADSLYSEHPEFTRTLPPAST